MLEGLKQEWRGESFCHSRDALYIFLTQSSSGKFAETRDGLDSRGADRHRVSPNHPKFHQNSPRAVDEWGNELFLMFEKLGVKKYEK